MIQDKAFLRQLAIDVYADRTWRHRKQINAIVRAELAHAGKVPVGLAEAQNAFPQGDLDDVSFLVHGPVSEGSHALERASISLADRAAYLEGVV